jgi:hypothetical protein
MEDDEVDDDDQELDVVELDKEDADDTELISLSAPPFTSILVPITSCQRHRARKVAKVERNGRRMRGEGA